MNIILCLTILIQMIMINRLSFAFRHVKERHAFTNINSLHIYIMDWANKNGGDVEVSDTKSNVINSVHLDNQSNLTVFFDGFKKDALPISRSEYSKQCECVLFPKCCDKEEWVLFVETKYAKDLQRAQKKEANYPNRMVGQIKETVKYFRNKDIIPPDKIVYAIISFPNLVEEFSSWVFPIIRQDGTEESILDILQNDRIIIRATNNAQIINAKLLLLKS